MHPTLGPNDPEAARLDPPGDPRFHAVAKLVVATFDVPIVLISLVDGDREWFEVRYGLDVAETPREVPFCRLLLAESAALVVGDARADDRLVGSGLVMGEPHLRFFAGVPLRAAGGRVLGALCAIDLSPREWSARERETLQLLGGQVATLIELRQNERTLREQHELAFEREMKLADRERMLTSLLGGMVEGVVLQDHNGAILHHNAAAARILGLSREELTGRTSVDPRWRATRADGSTFPGEEHPAMVTLRTGEPQSDVEMCLETADGERRWISINSRPLRTSATVAPYAVVATFRDITDTRDLAEKLARHQRLVTTGTLAAGVGHEINNPLTYAMTNLGVAIEELEDIAGASPSQRLREIVGLLADAREGGERVKRIVRGLRSLVREETELQPIDVNKIVRTSIQMANQELRTRSTVDLDLGESPFVMGDEARLSQVVINILVNAAQAFTAADPSRNRIVVRTRVEGSVIIEVRDNGPGIQPEVFPRIFDPFFTTKAPGVGMGLGLAIAHVNITAFGGELDCESTVGEGTTFRIRLPYGTGEVEPVRDPAPARSPLRLLVLDDEPSILKAFRRVFRDAPDVEIVSSDDSREALERIRAGEHFDLVFSDLAMPYLNGPAFHEAVLATHPEVAERIVFLSGDMGRVEHQIFLARVPNERFEKPFTPGDLRAVVRRARAARR